MCCKHSWIDTDDGSFDKLCVLCDKRAKQAFMVLPLSIHPTVPAVQPIMRETITISMGGCLGSVDVYKDKIAEEVSKAFKMRGSL